MSQTHSSNTLKLNSNKNTQNQIGNQLKKTAK